MLTGLRAYAGHVRVVASSMDRWHGAGPVGLSGRLVLPGDDCSEFDAISSCPELEPWAQIMAVRSAGRIKYIVGDHWTPLRVQTGVCMPGPEFLHSASNYLFSGRQGNGPLRIAWDTNVLTDYFQYGARLWLGATAAELVPDSTDRRNQRLTSLYTNLEFLQHVIALWTLRDIEFLVLPATLSDFKQKATQSPSDGSADDERSRVRRAQRDRALWEFSAAVSLTSADESVDDVPLKLPQRTVDDFMRGVPKGHDALLIRQALAKSCHVFLTRDGGVLKRAGDLAHVGLCVADPQRLFWALLKSGNFDCLLDGYSLYWPWRDTLRTAHLLHALDFHQVLVDLEEKGAQC